MLGTHNSAKVGSIPSTCMASSQEALGQNSDCPVDLYGQITYNIRVNNKTMTVTSKFKKDISTLRSAVKGDYYLDVKNPKLFKKVRKFYENSGVVFSGDPLDDYDILIDCIAEDLESVEVA
jgi:hypothetical protein